MATLAELAAELSQLEQGIEDLKKQGDILLDCRIDSSKPGGTAGPSARPHHRIRYKVPHNGKKSQYLKPSEVAEKMAAIARGKDLKKLEKQRQSVVQKIDSIRSKIAALQG